MGSWEAQAVFEAKALSAREWAETGGDALLARAAPSHFSSDLERLPVLAGWEGLKHEMLGHLACGHEIVRASQARILIHDWKKTNPAGGRSSFVFSKTGGWWNPESYWLFLIGQPMGPYLATYPERRTALLDFTGPAQTVRLEGAYIYLGGQGNWGHWIIDIIGNLSVALDNHPELVGLPLILDGITDEQRQSLRLLGLGHHPLIELGAYADEERIFLPDTLYMLDKAPAPVIRDSLRRRMEKAAPPVEGVHPKRLFLSRAHLKPRHRVDNEDAVRALLQDRGFVTVHPEQEPVAKLLSMMRQAEIVAMPQGAAFGNLPFAPQDAAFIVLSPPILASARFDSPLLRQFRRVFLGFGEQLQIVEGEPADGVDWIDPKTGVLTFAISMFDQPCRFHPGLIDMALLRAEAWRIRQVGRAQS